MATRINLEVDTKGPFFTGAYQSELHKHLDEAKAEVAQMGVNRIQERIGARAKNPSGGYSGSVVTDVVQPFNDQVISLSGRAVTYGPWIEGTSTRNSTTRFKGYRIFRQVRSWLRKQATPMAQTRIDEFVNRMNGGG